IVPVSIRLGALLEQRGDPVAALDIYRAALDWDPKARDALRAVVRLSEGRDDSFDIADACERLLALETGTPAVDLALRLAELRDKQGARAEAERALELGFTGCPQSETLKERLAERYAARLAWRPLAELYARGARAHDGLERARGLVAAAEVLRERAE